jgi:hypothetical protein
MRKLYIFLSLITILALLFVGPGAYHYFFPKAKIERDFRKAQREYEKTHDINTLQTFVDNNKDSIKKVSGFLIDNRDSIIVYHYNDVLRAAMASTYNSANLARNEQYRITDKLTLIVKDTYPYVPDPENEDKFLTDLFSELEPVEISDVIEKQKSIVYIVKEPVWVHSYDGVDGMKKQGEAYRWKYLVYVIDLINRKTIAYHEFLGDLPPSRTIKNTNDKYFKEYGPEPSMVHIELWYSRLPVQ